MRCLEMFSFVQFGFLKKSFQDFTRRNRESECEMVDDEQRRPIGWIGRRKDRERERNGRNAEGGRTPAVSLSIYQYWLSSGRLWLSTFELLLCIVSTSQRH